MEAKILINDVMLRFEAGEIGKVIENDFDKYDYCIRLESNNLYPFPRTFYFYSDEVEIIR